MELMREVQIGPRKPGERPRTFWLSDPAAISRQKDLCSVCRRIDLSALVSQESGNYEVANLGLWVDIKEKAGECRFCRMVVTTIVEGWRAIIDWESCKDLEMTECGLDSGLCVKVYPIPAEAAAAKIRLGLTEACRLDVLSDDAERIGLGDFGKLFHNRIVSREVIEVRRMKEWLEICQNFHSDKCGKEIEENIGKVPSSLRVIDIQDQRLVPVDAGTKFWSKKPSFRRYVALSYVWGQITSVGQYRTTKENFQERTKKGALKNAPFPRTIRDAMVVTGLIGERYLWVDAVCIIQDDEADQKAQINSMNIVYGAAFLTIVAAGGANANSSLPRSHSGSPSTVVQDIELISGVHVIRPLPTLFNLETVESLAPAWFTRGWTYQERELSTRLLFFTTSQAFFQCREFSYSEDFLAEQHTHTLEKGFGIYENIGNNLRQSFGPLNSSFIMNVYTRLVEHYTARSLSFDSDALNAFTGVGKVLSEVHGPQYALHYGLLGTFLEQALTWQPATPAPLVRRPDFPSWSWVGWRGAVKYRNSSSDWMLLDGQNTVSEHTITTFYLHPGRTPLPGPKKPNLVYDSKFRKPYSRPPAPPPQPPSQPPPQSIPDGTLEFMTTRVPGNSLKVRTGDIHIPPDGTCHCFLHGARAPPLAAGIRTIIDAAGVAAGSVYIHDTDFDAPLDLEQCYWICLARAGTRGAKVSCPGFDTAVYERLTGCVFELLLVRYDSTGVAARVAAGRVHEDAWVAAEGLEWATVWLR
ncbi:heterokaryon incompatibility protein-domain-containing protein [Geopyxis carbonaria]|nr:heterokaryon incompatibility protein-domain-containing protein [Geopyxis carbonaria]